ncbi:hypothetical protein CIK75_01395 [Glutamicibacter sp. BW78]|nr:hypothetical protein CIK75_01395 [Glutamicibacter sp. BW78]
MAMTIGSSNSGQDVDSAPTPIEGTASSGTWFDKHPRVVDLVIVLAVFSYNLPIQIASVPDNLWSGSGILVSLGLCTPYLFRRRFPLRVFIVILLVVAVQLLLGIGLLVADVMLLFALYNLASRHRWATTIPAASAVVLMLLVATAAPIRLRYMSIGDVGLLVFIAVWTWTWGALVKARREHVASLRQRALQLEREREAHGQVVAARERARIAREIHDIVSHSLGVVVVLADGAASTTHSDPDRAQKAMETVRDTGRGALAEMRSMLGVLRSDEPGSHAPQPGIGQVDQLIEDSRAAGLPVTLKIQGERIPVPTGVDLAVYRTVQEALTNIRKHAGSQVSHVEVLIIRSNTSIEVQVVDDGHGPKSPHQRPHEGYGLFGMRERISAYGGTLHTGQRREKGFEVRANLPIGGPE